MRIRFDNVNLNSSSGPNNFAARLAKDLLQNGVDICLDDSDADMQLSFIQYNQSHEKIIQRLDGIYFNSEQDWQSLNLPIRITYSKAASVIFQSEFNKRLTEKYFGEHPSSYVIHNGTNLETIAKIPALQHKSIDRFESIWCCASSWRPHKRLKENIRYFLEHSSEKECLVIAGQNVDHHVMNERIFYVGNLDWETLIALMKRSRYFIHLALMDHCPNVVVDARAAGCSIICADSGGTKEIAGSGATVIKDMEWDLEPFKLYDPPELDFSKKYISKSSNNIDIKEVSKKYTDVFKKLV